MTHACRLALSVMLTAAALVFAAEGASLWALQTRFSTDIAEFLWAGRMVYLFGFASAGCAVLAGAALAYGRDLDAAPPFTRAVLLAHTFLLGFLLLVVLPIGLFVTSIR